MLLFLLVLGLGVVASAGAGSHVRVHLPAPGLRFAPKWTGAKEVVEMRRESARVFRRSDGLMRADVYDHPINFKDGRGHLQPIDNRLVPASADGYALRNAANSYRLELPTDIGGRPVRIDSGRDSVSFALLGAHAPVARSAGGARFDDVLPGVSLEYLPGYASVKENLTLTSADAVHDFAFDVHPSRSVRPTLTKSGAIEFRDRRGRSRFAFAPPYMSDAGGDGTDRRGDISFGLEPLHRHHWKLTLRTSAQWLGDANRKFPVVVDPTFVRPHNQFPARDCFIESANPGASHCADTTVDAGSDGSGTRRALFQPNLDFYQTFHSIQILDATLNTFVSSFSGVPASFSIYRLGRTFDSSNVTWNSPWSSPGGDLAGGALDTETVAAGNVNVSWHLPPSLVQHWYDKSDTVTGLLIKQDNENGSAMAHFRAEEACAGTCPAPLQFYFKTRSGTRSDLTYVSQPLTDRLSIGVQASSGNLLMSLRELYTAGKGFALGVNHYFDPLAKTSRSDESSDGSITDGWLTDTGSHVGLEKFADGSVAYYAPGGAAYAFDPVTPGSSTYRPADGLHASLTRNADQTYDLKFDASGEVYHFETNGFLLTDKSRNGSENEYGYTNGKVTAIVDSENLLTTLTYDASGRLSTIRHNASGRTWTYGYGATNQLTSSTDPNGKTTTYHYDTSGQLDKITDPRGHDTNIAYNNKRVSSITRVTNPSTGAGATTTFSYSDGNGFITCNDSAHEPTLNTVVTDPNGHNTTYCFDRLDRAWRVVDANGRTRATHYSPFGDVDQYTPATLGTAGFNVSAVYDTNTNVLNQIKEGSTPAYDFTYDSGKFNPRKITDPQGHDTNIDYDLNGNAERIYDIQGSVTVHHNGPGGQVSDVIDGNNHTTTFGYGTAGNLRTITPPVPLGSTLITYDNAIRVKTVTDGKGQMRTYDYDGLSRVTKITFSDGSSVSLSYDPNGNLVSRTDTSSTGGTQTTTYAYDDLNRLVSQTFPNGQTTNYGYDVVGNLTSLQDAGGTVTYTHDEGNLLRRMHEPGSANDYVFGYDNGGFRNSTLFPNGVSVNKTNDDHGRPTRILARGPGGTPTLKDLRYGYTPSTSNGRTNNELTRLFVNGLNNNITSYDYDERDRLKEAVTTNGLPGPQVRRFSYTYDGANNRLTQTKDLGSGPQTTTYGYNDANEMLSAGSTTYTYDPNGNETSWSGGPTMIYNAQDQMKTLGTLALSYLGPNQVELTSDGAALVSNDVLGVASRGQEFYTRADDGEVLAKRNGASNSWYLHDGIGSVVGGTDASGASTGGYNYDPFGNPLGTAPNIPWGYAGGYAGPWGGIYHFGYRFYDPTVGRWMQQDPIMSPGGLREANRYAYVGNSPIDRIDPAGLWSLDIEIGGYVGVGGSVGISIGDDGVGVTGSLGGGAGINVNGSYSSGHQKWGNNVEARGCVLLCGSIDDEGGTSVGCCGAEVSPFNIRGRKRLKGW